MVYRIPAAVRAQAGWPVSDNATSPVVQQQRQLAEIGPERLRLMDAAGIMRNAYYDNLPNELGLRPAMAAWAGASKRQFMCCASSSTACSTATHACGSSSGTWAKTCR